MFRKEKKYHSEQVLIDIIANSLSNTMKDMQNDSSVFLKKLNQDYDEIQKSFVGLNSKSSIEKFIGQVSVLLFHSDKNIKYESSYSNFFIAQQTLLNTGGFVPNIKGIKDIQDDYLENSNIKIKDYMGSKENQRELVIKALDKIEQDYKKGMHPFFQFFQAIIDFFNKINKPDTEEIRKARDTQRVYIALTGKELFAHLFTADKPEDAFRNQLSNDYRVMSRKTGTNEEVSVRQAVAHSLFEGKSKLTETREKIDNSRKLK